MVQHTEKVEKAEMEICFIKRKHKFSLAAVSLTKCHTDCENKRRVRSVDNLGECNHKLLSIHFQKSQKDFWSKKIITWSKSSPDLWRGFKYLLESKSTLYLQLKIDSMICVWFLPRFKGRIQIIESLFFLHLSYPERLQRLQVLAVLQVFDLLMQTV